MMTRGAGPVALERGQAGWWRWRVLVTLLCLAAHGAVVTSGVWHHHHPEEGDGGTTECGVCLAAAVDRLDGLAAGVEVVGPLWCVGFVEAEGQLGRDAASAWAWWARGPPAWPPLTLS